MTVYIEYVVADNLIVDYLLLSGSARILRLKCGIWSVLLASLVGTAFAVAFPLLEIAEVYSFLLKVACAALMCLISAKHRGFKGYLLHFNVFLLSSFAAGGAAYGLMYLTGINGILEAYYQARVLPVGIAALIVYFLYFGARSFAKRIADSAITVCGLIDCEIVIKGVAFGVKAFYDSGNFLEENRTGLPIVIADRKTFEKISSRVVMAKRGEKTVVSAGSRFCLPIYKMDYLRIKLKKKVFLKDAVLAVSENMSGISGADILIGKNLAGGAMNVEID